GLVQQLQNVRIAEANLDILLRTLGLLEANLEAGLIDIVQVDGFRQNIESQRANLLSAQIQLQSLIDQFKFQVLGLPPSLPVELDDSLLRQFEFIDPRATAVQHMLDDFVGVLGDLPESPSETDVRTAVELLSTFRDRVDNLFEGAKTDIEK